MVGGARERQRRLALERDPRPDRVERGAEARLRLLHRVEEDAVGAELADELRDREVVGDRLAPRADVPRVVVDEDAQPARLQVGDELADAGHLAVEVELVAVVDPDHGIGVPEHDPVEAAELALRLGAEALRREAAGLVVEEQLVPEPGERDDVAAARPGVLGRGVGGVVVADPRRRLGAPAGERLAPRGPVGRVVGRDEDLRRVERLEVGVRLERDGGRQVDRPRDERVARLLERDAHAAAGAPATASVRCTSSSSVIPSKPGSELVKRPPQRRRPALLDPVDPDGAPTIEPTAAPFVSVSQPPWTTAEIAPEKSSSKAYSAAATSAVLLIACTQW